MRTDWREFNALFGQKLKQALTGKWYLRGLTNFNYK